jgi:hypothetical protein
MGGSVIPPGPLTVFPVYFHYSDWSGRFKRRGTYAGRLCYASYCHYSAFLSPEFHATIREILCEHGDFLPKLSRFHSDQRLSNPKAHGISFRALTAQAVNTSFDLFSIMLQDSKKHSV